MKKGSYDESDVTLNWDFILDNINYHLEFNVDKEKIFLYIPSTVIISPVKDLKILYPEVLHLDRKLLYYEILRFIDSPSTIKSTIKEHDAKRFSPEPISVIEDVYYVAYDKRTDIIYLSLPARSIHTDLITVDIIYPYLKYMHEGILWEVVSDHIKAWR